MSMYADQLINIPQLKKWVEGLSTNHIKAINVAGTEYPIDKQTKQILDLQIDAFINGVINPFFHDYYQKKIAEGKTKRQALKCVQRRLVSIIWGMMKYRTEYINPPTHNYPVENETLS